MNPFRVKGAGFPKAEERAGRFSQGMTNAPFLVVEFPAAGAAMLDFTRRNEGVTIDIISEPVVDTGKDRIHPSTVLVKGVDEARLKELVGDLERAYGPPRTLRRDLMQGTWLGRVMIKESGIRDRGAIALLQFQHQYGVPWTHCEGGVLHMRARVSDLDGGLRLAQRVRGYLHASGVEAQVDIQELDAGDHSVWGDLVQHSIGLAP